MTLNDTLLEIEKELTALKVDVLQLRFAEESGHRTYHCNRAIKRIEDLGEALETTLVHINKLTTKH